VALLLMGWPVSTFVRHVLSHASSCVLPSFSISGKNGCTAQETQ
jgi:hypothetical protein